MNRVNPNADQQHFEPSVNSEALIADDGLEVGGMSEVQELIRETSDQSSQGNSASDSSVQSTRTPVDTTVNDRESLRDRLLQRAPSPTAMKNDIERVYSREKADLEKEVRHLSRGHDYHALSSAISKLREVYKKIESLARLSFEALQELWLKVVHQFA